MAATPPSASYLGRELTSTHLTRMFSFDGEKVALMADLQIFEYYRWGGCVHEFKTRFHLGSRKDMEEDREGDYVGYKFGFTIDKTSTIGQSDRPAWLVEILKRPKDYDTKTLFTHNHSDDDPFDDMQKVMQILHKQDGSVRPEFEQHAEMLAGDAVHYINSFRIEEDYWGTGLARVCMKTYLDLISSMDRDYRFEGPVLGSPAAMQSVYDQIAEAYKNGSAEPPTHLYIEQRLIEGYQKDGFEVLFRALASDQGAGISIVGQKIARRLVTASQKHPEKQSQSNHSDDDMSDDSLELMKHLRPERAEGGSGKGQSNADNSAQGNVTPMQDDDDEDEDGMDDESDNEGVPLGMSDNSSFDPFLRQANVAFAVDYDKDDQPEAVYFPTRWQYAQMTRMMSNAEITDGKQYQTRKMRRLTGATRNTAFRVVKPRNRRRELRALYDKLAQSVGDDFLTFGQWKKTIL